MRKLFKRFSQAKTRSHASYGGSGLGLYISRELAEKMGGQVGVASVEGKGTAFAFYIETRAAERPVDTPDSFVSTSTAASKAKEPLEELSEVPELPSPLEKDTGPVLPIISERMSAEAQPPKVPGVHILLVEDNLINQRVLAQQLRKQDYAVTVASHGQDALRILEEAGYWRSSSEEDVVAAATIDVVLMDVEMPVMNGLQCTRRIRELESQAATARKLPIIALSANVREDQQDTVFEAGMDSFLPKPVTVVEVSTRIQDLMALVARDDVLR